MTSWECVNSASYCEKRTSPRYNNNHKLTRRRSLHTHLVNAPRYAVFRSTPSKKASSSKKKGRIRERRLSNALPPWPNINVDLVCEHGSLVRSSKPGAKRKVIDKKVSELSRNVSCDERRNALISWTLCKT